MSETSLDRKVSEGSSEAEGVQVADLDSQVEIPSSKENVSSVFTIICSGKSCLSASYVKSSKSNMPFNSPRLCFDLVRLDLEVIKF